SKLSLVQAVNPEFKADPVVDIYLVAVKQRAYRRPQHHAANHQLLSEARKGGVKVAAGASAGNYVNSALPGEVYFISNPPASVP
ncbi:hypothetical protein Q6249_28925, partial [Klebsiella pneumoniae]|nr:hypothetical protein [Klebsiella pneumoniae]